MDSITTNIEDVKKVEELRELEGGKKWDVKKLKADEVSVGFSEYGDSYGHEMLENHAQRVADCSNTVQLVWREGKLHLKSAYLCHVRTCPVCAWRRSLALKRVFMERFPAIASAYPTARYLFLTLTVRNCPITELRASLKAMSLGWARLMDRRWLKPFLLGSIRAVEVTRSKTEFDVRGIPYAHPHYHAILMVSSEYFCKRKHYYRRTEDWVTEWQSAMRLDYSPMVWVRVCRQNTKHFQAVCNEVFEDRTAKARLLFKAVQSGVQEVLKYSVKDSDIYGDAWYADYALQIPHMRYILGAGVLKSTISLTKRQQEEQEEFEEEIEPEEVEKVLTFTWNKGKGKYLVHKDV